MYAPGNQHRQGSLADFLGRTPGSDRQEETEILIKLNQRRRALLVGYQADLDRFRPVILALKQLATTAIADTRDFWRALRRVEHGFALRQVWPPLKREMISTTGSSYLTTAVSARPSLIISAFRDCA